MSAIWQTIIFIPIFNLLIVLYSITGSLGLSIILFTLVIRAIMVPIMAPSLKMNKKQRDLQPQIQKLRKKYKNNQKELYNKQMELFKQHGINPAKGCLMPIITIVFMIAVYSSVRTLTIDPDIPKINSDIYLERFELPEEYSINTSFLYLDLSKPDPTFIITIIAVALQFLIAKMMMPYVDAQEKAVKKTPEKTDDIMQSLTKQNMYMTPLLFLIFGATLPSGVMIYITTSTFFQLAQTYLTSGWGGLTPWINKLKSGKLSTNQG